VELSQEEFDVLWKVEHSWENNPEYASDNTNESIKKFTKIFLKLEEEQLLFIHITNNKIDSATVTDKGLHLLNDSHYYAWAHELKESHQL
jgi:predicted transcriptional regulator